MSFMLSVFTHIPNPNNFEMIACSYRDSFGGCGITAAFPTSLPHPGGRWTHRASFLHDGGEEKAGGTPGKVLEQSCALHGVSRGLWATGEKDEGCVRTEAKRHASALLLPLGPSALELLQDSFPSRDGEISAQEAWEWVGTREQHREKGNGN